MTLNCLHSLWLVAVALFLITFDNPWLDTVEQTQSLVVKAYDEERAVAKFKDIVPMIGNLSCKRVDPLKTYRIRYCYRKTTDWAESPCLTAFVHAPSESLARLRFSKANPETVIKEILGGDTYHFRNLPPSI